MPEILISREEWYEYVHHVCWHQHGGSGSSMTYRDVLRLPYDVVIDMGRKNRAQRQAENRAIQNARAQG